MLVQKLALMPLPTHVADEGVIDIASLEITNAPVHGTAVIDTATGRIIYTHDGQSTQTDMLTYRVANEASRYSLEAQVTIVIDDDLSPIAEADSGVFGVGESIEIAVLLNDTDDGELDAGSVTIVSGPAGGIASVDGVTGVITYTQVAMC